MDPVFVVENDRSSRHALVRLLNAAGNNVRNFASIEDFLCSLEPSPCGCLVLDADVPGTSGQELLAKGFFRKPVDGTALIDAIEWALRSKNRNGNH